jgi:hypothetical protein
MHLHMHLHWRATRRHRRQLASRQQPNVVAVELNSRAYRHSHFYITIRGGTCFQETPQTTPNRTETGDGRPALLPKT